MKAEKMKPKKRRFSDVLRKQNKRGIHVKGKWKPIELDPSVFSEEGLEGLVCFEELRNYRLVDCEKAGVMAATDEKNKKKKKGKKRKASEGDEDGEKGDSESKEGEEILEPAKKKKNKKKNDKKSAQPGDKPVKGKQKDVATGEGAVDDEPAGEDICSEPDAEPVPAKKSNKKKKKKKKGTEKGAVPDAQSNQKSPSEAQKLEKEKSSDNKVTKPKKKQLKNWTNAALSGCTDENADVSAWKDLFVPSPVLKALSSLGFSSPTPIQALALPSAIRDRMDILGAAETGKILRYMTPMFHKNVFPYFCKKANMNTVIAGSGKTLAFGIPMIHAILEWKKKPATPEDENTKPCTQVESLYLPETANTEESTLDEDEMEAEADDSEDEEEDNQRLGCVQVIDNAEFDFDETVEAEQTPSGSPLLGLVLTPTRELAVQVKHHIDAAAKFTGESLSFKDSISIIENKL